MCREFTVILSFQLHSFNTSGICTVHFSKKKRRKKRCHTIVQWHLNSPNSDANLVSERQKVTWRHAHNVVSLRILYIFVNFNSTLVIWLKFAFIEMLDKLTTYIVFWYTTMYQVLPVVWTNCITTRRYHTTGSTWYRVLYQHTMYVMSIYHV